MHDRERERARVGCGEREIVFAGSAGLLYPSFDGPNSEMAETVRAFYTTGQWKYVKKADKLGYGLEAPRDDAQNSTVKVFIAPQELQRRQKAVEFGPLFGLIVSEVIDTNAWPTLFWPFAKKISGVLSCFKVGTGCCVCMKSRKHFTIVEYRIIHLYVL